MTFPIEKNIQGQFVFDCLHPYEYMPFALCINYYACMLTLINVINATL